MDVQFGDQYHHRTCPIRSTIDGQRTYSIPPLNVQISKGPIGSELRSAVGEEVAVAVVFWEGRYLNAGTVPVGRPREGEAKALFAFGVVRPFLFLAPSPRVRPVIWRRGSD